jgi:SAM-dependent methyltransferase
MIRALSRALIYRAPQEAEACPACASRALFELDLLVLRREIDRSRTGFITGCRSCGLVFANPVPSREALREFYSPGGEWHADRVSDAAPTDAAPMDAARTLASASTSWIRWFDPIRDELTVTSPPAGASVLDFGCGNGSLLDALQQCGWETWGIETASDVAFQRHGRLDAVPDRPLFDLIVCHHVLEHVTNPLELLTQFAAAARPGAHLLVTVPRLDTLPEHGDYFYVINARAHVTAYTWPCLQGLLARAGWQPVAPPPDRLPRGRTKQTASRLRVIARRAGNAVAAPASPADAAQQAVRRYLAGVQGRSLFERLEWYRIAARQAEARRRSAASARRAARRRMVI